MDMAILLAALISVETGGDLTARNQAEGAVGCLQIRPMCVQEINRYYGTSFHTEDLLGNERLSRWICLRYMELYAAENYEEAARLWNGGPDWRSKRSKTDAYWAKVRVKLKELGAAGEPTKWASAKISKPVLNKSRKY